MSGYGLSLVTSNLVKCPENAVKMSGLPEIKNEYKMIDRMGFFSIGSCALPMKPASSGHNRVIYEREIKPPNTMMKMFCLLEC